MADSRRGGAQGTPPTSNDNTARERMWRRFDGDDWAAFDRLPPAVRRQLAEHAYDVWAVNALMLWRRFRRTRASALQAERALLRYLDECEALEQAAFAASHLRRHGTTLPHVAAGATVLRHGSQSAACHPVTPPDTGRTPPP